MSTYLLAFTSTHAALAMQSAFKKAAIASVLIPTPSSISAGCGMTLRFNAQDDNQAVQYVRKSDACVTTAQLFCETDAKQYLPLAF